MTPDIFAGKIGSDGTQTGARVKLDLFMDPGLGIVLVAPDGTTLYRLTVDQNGVLQTQAVTI